MGRRGGVWTNTEVEVGRYLGEDGNRAWVDGSMDTFRNAVSGWISATTLHEAIHSGKG
jgi:hypothetical protein